jgi:aminoglycoside phosphotransferase family enzyme/predicted kinase
MPDSPVPAPAAIAETHLSVVVFVGDHAYKLKKAVQFPFIDLRTREARERVCRREVELNRRLAPDVYEGVADVVGPDGQVCDHLVVMRRMPPDRRLSTLVAAGDPAVPGALVQLAGLLARFHRAADRSPQIDVAGHPDTLLARWRDNGETLRRFDGTMFPAGATDEVVERAAAYLSGRGPLLERRRAEGWICDGHGDLLADDVFVLPDGPRVLDCIEFDDALRHGDVVADIAFLAMDLERLGAVEEADRFVHAYEEASGATLPRSLLHLSIAYRAQVRALVTALRAEQEGSGKGAADAELARRLLALCRRHVRAATPRLVLVGGLPGTGKSTLARALGERYGWPVRRADVVRKELAGESAETSMPAPFGEGPYTAEARDRVYDALAERAAGQLAMGESVVVDATFNAARHREAFAAVARATASELVELRCTLDPVEAAARLARRQAAGGDASDADAAVAARLAAEADPWPSAVDVPTAAAPDEVAEIAARVLHDRGALALSAGRRSGARRRP